MTAKTSKLGATMAAFRDEPVPEETSKPAVPPAPTQSQQTAPPARTIAPAPEAREEKPDPYVPFTARVRESAVQKVNQASLYAKLRGERLTVQDAVSIAINAYWTPERIQNVSNKEAE
jgi:hypothetical protein